MNKVTLITIILMTAAYATAEEGDVRLNVYTSTKPGCPPQEVWEGEGLKGLIAELEEQESKSSEAEREKLRKMREAEEAKGCNYAPLY